jgi:ABC-type iron transport system FetAB permease component
MSIISVFVSSILGIILGFAYGLSFTRRKAFCLSNNKSQNFVRMSGLSIVRIASLAYILFYIIQADSIQTSLVVILFVVTSWSIILKNKVLYDGNRII